MREGLFSGKREYRSRNFQSSVRDHLYFLQRAAVVVIIF